MTEDKRDTDAFRYYQNNPNASKMEWINLIGNDVFSKDEVELGKIEAVNKDFVVVKKGAFNAKRYYIFHSFVKGTDGKEVWLKIPSDEAAKYRNDDKIPNPANFTTLGSMSHMAYPPIPYMPKEMLKQKD